MKSVSEKSIFRTLPSGLVKKERAAAIRNKKSLDGIATAAYDVFFFRITRSERKAALDKIPKKVMGRKVR